MLSLSRHFRHHPCPRRVMSAGFTLVEIVIALAVLGTMASGAYLGFNAVNTYAVSSRLFSEAQTAAQNQIDLILSREPFDVMLTPTRVPLELMTSAELAALNPPLGSSAPAMTSSYYPYYLSNGALARDAFIYTDPTTGNIIVKGTVTTQVGDVGATETLESTTMALNIRRCTVTVSYTFRNTNYTVVMDTMRTADR